MKELNFAEIERRRKISESLKKQHADGKRIIKDATKIKISQTLKGRKLSQEIIDKIQESRAGYKHSNKTKSKMSISNKKSCTNEVKNKLSLKSKQQWANPETRKKLIDALQKTKYLKVRCDIGQLELLDKWNRLGFNFEPNYQIRCNDNIYYLDGYDKEKNIVIEYDGGGHATSYDLPRQNEIIELLKPKKFWRYNRQLKTMYNVLNNKDLV